MPIQKNDYANTKTRFMPIQKKNISEDFSDLIRDLFQAIEFVKFLIKMYPFIENGRIVKESPFFLFGYLLKVGR